MRGILWRWLFFLGTIFWISLCIADYHQKYLQQNFRQTLKNMEIRIEPPPAPTFFQLVPQKRKLQAPTPALTFWKFLSIVFSVSAIVIIKRLSTFRKKNLPVSSCSDFDLIRAPYGSFITRVPPISNNRFNVPIFHQEFQVARLENGNSGDTKSPTLVGVKIVQKKLEDLENNIATLKQRISSNSSSNPASQSSDPIKKVLERNLAANQSYFGPIIPSNTGAHSSLSSNPPESIEIKLKKDIPKLETPRSFDTTPITPSLTRVSSKQNPEKIPTPDKSSGKSGNSSIKEVKFNQKTYELENDIISLKDLKDSMSSKNIPSEARKIGPLNFDETYEKVKKDLSELEFKSNSHSLADSYNLSSKRTTSPRKSRSKFQLSENKVFLDSKSNSTTLPSLSSRKSHEGSSKSFPMDGTSSTKLFTDSNTTTSTMTSMRKKRFLKSIKDRKREFKSINPISASIATYLAPNFQSTSFPHTKHRREHGSYAAINRKKAHALRELKTNTAKILGYDRISVSSSNESTDSIDKFVAKILKPDSDATLLKHSSDDLSMASTSISSLTASSSTFMSGTNVKIESVTNSIRSMKSILPLSRTTISSNLSSIGNSRNMPGGAEPLSSAESIIEKNTSKYGTNFAIHSLAMNYLKTLERKTESQEKMRDSGSEFSITTKSVLEKYKSKTKNSSAASSHQNILEDKYWLLHW